MIAACPNCSARYRVDGEKIGPEGARLRCAKCEAVFRVRVPEAVVAPTAAADPIKAAASPAVAPQPVAPEQPVAAAAAVAPPASAPAEAPAPAPVAAAKVGAAVEEAPSEPRIDRSRAILIADPDVEAGKVTASRLIGWGLQPILVHDGVEAMMTIQRALPRVVVLDAALPKMFGFQICEVMKRNESLRDIRVILVGSIHHQSRYRRPPTDLYGADLYLEQPDMPDGLRPLLAQSGLRFEAGEPMAPLATPQPTQETSPPPMPAAPEHVAPAPEPVAPAAPAPQVQAPGHPAEPLQPAAPQQPTPPTHAAAPVQPAAPSVAAPDPASGEERAKAERLARIIVSDIVLYQPEKFDEAVRAGNVAGAMESSLEEGRKLMRERVDPGVLAETDYLITELERVARERKG